MYGFDLDYDYEDDYGYEDFSSGDTFGNIQPGGTFQYRKSKDDKYSTCTKLKQTIIYKDGYGTAERMANAINEDGEPFYLSDLTIVSLPDSKDN